MLQEWVFALTCEREILFAVTRLGAGRILLAFSFLLSWSHPSYPSVTSACNVFGASCRLDTGAFLGFGLVYLIYFLFARIRLAAFLSLQLA